MNASKPQAKLDMRLRATECPNGSQPPNDPHRKPSTMRLMKSVFMGVCSERVLAKTNMSASGRASSRDEDPAGERKRE